LFLAAIFAHLWNALIVELGIFFDVLVAAMVLGILVFASARPSSRLDVSGCGGGNGISIAQSAASYPRNLRNRLTSIDSKVSRMR